MNTRLILCHTCTNWHQAPNAELGTCILDNIENTTYYDSRCIYGLYEKVICPDIQTQNITTKLCTYPPYYTSCHAYNNGDCMNELPCEL